MAVTARSERPISRCISSVRPPCLPLVASRGTRSAVALGIMAYSAVTQPRPCPLRNGGTFSSTDTVQMTFVAPISIRTDPSACLMKLRWMTIGRNSSERLPSMRIKEEFIARHYTCPVPTTQFASQRRSGVY